MFMGEFIHSIDAKGRIIMPSKFRDEVPEGSFVITRGLDGCLFVYTEEEWAAFDSKLQSLPLINKGTRQLNRFFHAGVIVVEPDKQGRVLIPATLREYAALDKDVCLVGMGNKIEVWNVGRQMLTLSEMTLIRFLAIWKSWASLFNVKSVMFWRL